MTPNKFIALFFILILVSVTAFSQKKALKKANAAFDTGEYFAAAEIFEKVFEKLKTKAEKAEVSFKVGECYRIMNKPRKSRTWYRKAVRNKSNNPYSVLYYAEALKMLEEYDDAKIQYENFKKLLPDDERGKYGIRSCELIDVWRKDPSRYIIQEIKDINSKFSDFSPSYGRSKSEIYFTSTRQSTEGKNASNITGEGFADIFLVSKDRKGKWSVPVPVEGGVNTIDGEGSAVLVNGGATMYYTGCKQIEGANTGCKIYKSKKSGKGWSEPKIEEIINDSSISVGHPAITKDELTLYFVSDGEFFNKKGKGGKDIWKCTRPTPTGRWGKPVNMGNEINTKGDEMFPFVREDGILFFASDGLPGMGGLDIFKAVKEGNAWKVTNLRPPINSYAHDFGITFYEDQEVGYFTSSRKKSDDLYSLKKPSLIFTLKGKVTNSQTDEALADASVKLTSPSGYESEIKSASDGTFVFNLEPKTDYTVTGSKKDFLMARVSESTKPYKSSKTLEVILDLPPIRSTFELPNIEYDVADTTLREESKVSLDKLVELLNVNSNITIELSANTDFRGGDDYNQKLSRGRANSVVHYLISKGIKKDRLTAVGNGERNPKKIDGETKNGRGILKMYDFLKSGDVLSEDYINNLETKEQIESAHQLNRRTEFRVLRDDYGINAVKFGG